MDGQAGGDVDGLRSPLAEENRFRPPAYVQAGGAFTECATAGLIMDILEMLLFTPILFLRGEFYVQSLM